MSIPYRFEAILLVLLTTFLYANAQDKKESVRKTIWYAQPATDWLQALRVRNGRLGAMVFGDPKYERIQLNENLMWLGGADWGDSKGNVEDLDHFRQFLKDGKPHEVDAEYMDKFSCQTIVRSRNLVNILYSPALYSKEFYFRLKSSRNRSFRRPFMAWP